MQRMKVEAQKTQNMSQQTSHLDTAPKMPQRRAASLAGGWLHPSWRIATPEARLKVQEACQQHVANLGAQEALHQTQEVCVRKLAFHRLANLKLK